MRGLLTTGLVLLQLPALALGLPRPVSVPEAASEKPVVGDSLLGAPNSQLSLKADAPLTNNDNNNPPPSETSQTKGDLTQELADLRALRAQLIALAKEVHDRETWLSDATRAEHPPSSSSPPPPLSILDCESPACVIRSTLRKARYATGSSSSYHDDWLRDREDESQTTTGTEAEGKGPVIPLPPWRGGDGSGRVNCTASAFAGDGGDDGFDWFVSIIRFSLIPFYVLVALVLVGLRVGMGYLVRYIRHRRRGCHTGMVAHRSEEMRYGEERAGGPEWPRYADEKAGFEYEYTAGDEKVLLEEGEWTGWLPECERLRNEEEAEARAASDVAEEIREFRSAVDLIESLVAGEEVRSAERRA